MTDPAESGRLSVDLGADLAARLRAYSEADRRSVDAVVADAVEEYLGTHPNHEQARAAGLAAMREHEAEYGAFSEVERAEAAAWIDRIMGRSGDDQSGPREGGPLDGRDV
ncbi:ribbon-helix-helix domain-containing protein [Streptomyces fulvoviolaceus]|uniref:ribbon-helix-helix domain-containing protein n=1 Tax=Streptomyces fulvoviolaceus TaxID=285535 RepID=UPI0021BE29D2|nr:ribbon-helix-helix domain-containing protein [Streptomyces fulvoviolaceus]MCT9076920.1 ribbon-helix-helix domain-containing protein [Streptomyces fulvoviolaceus]